ncbi:AfsR/SARP family transcriptional regulator [Plantactinospora endophytica]|uniref:SARP family transcriptional regulator n=1 Tax=Plantactinospora endophytica TaxID=673535 RepID=A0ABQ4E1Y5_9ACTN|nr:BTAD domain-containing putative transcriptional regulator [Plantactinospora endophytica]GIG88719.1 SARP family transcriptional regulator [Plantactinospora endophytica]
MRFQILGPVQVEHDGRPVAVGRRRERCLLGLLLLEAGRPVPIHRLVDLLWAGDPPDTAPAVLSTYVSRLRTALNAAGDGSGEVLVRRGDGYAIEVDAEAVDAHRFSRLVEQARSVSGAGRADLLRQALGLWRGTPLADAPEPLRDRVCAGLERLRGSATLLRIETDLAMGGHEELLGELTELVERDPSDEVLAGHLMVALYRAGRRQDALQTYHRARQRLADELGLDPGAQLSDLARAILRGDPVLDLDPADEDAPAGRDDDAGFPPSRGDLRAGPYARVPPSRPVVPAQLPLSLPVFVGRHAELDRLDAVLLPAADPPSGLPVAVVSGTAGVGKTALAVQWAHRRAERFPDGQLYVDLSGFAPTGSLPLRPDQAVRGFLGGLGVPPQRIPADPAEQVALYRTLVAGRRLLVVLDNAADADQVQPLLPGSPGCGVLVTSRNRMSGLVATVGATPLALDLPQVAEARQLLARRIGADRVAAEPEAVDEIISRCARLPLALALAAARGTTQPGFPLRALARELRTADGRLDGFGDGDPGTDVRAVFAGSYHTLTARAARLFRLFGLHLGAEIGVSAAASLLGEPVAAVQPALAELARANLLVERSPGRYGCHDLLRAYAAELVRDRETEPERQQAVRRLLDHYLHAAYAAARLTHPHRDEIATGPRLPGVTVEAFADPEQARAWFATEHPVLLALLGRDVGVDLGVDSSHAWTLAWTLAPFLDEHGHWHDLVTVLEGALATVSRLGDRPNQAYALRYLGIAYVRLDRHEDGHTHLRRALALFAELDDPVGQAQVQHNLALVAEQQSRHRDSLRHALRALELFRAAGHRIGQARALSSVGWCQAQLGDYEPALTSCYLALAEQQERGDRPAEAHTWNSLGYAHRHLGQFTEAIACYRRALDLFRRLGNRPAMADTLVWLGDARYSSGRSETARRAWLEAVDILDDLRRPDAARVRARLRQVNSAAFTYNSPYGGNRLAVAPDRS